MLWGLNRGEKMKEILAQTQKALDDLLKIPPHERGKYPGWEKTYKMLCRHEVKLLEIRDNLEKQRAA